jgi:hypothetical protein
VFVHVVSVINLDAVALSTPLVIVLVVSGAVLYLLVPPLVHFVVFVHIVILSNFDALVLSTHLYVACIVLCVAQVPLTVHFGVDCTIYNSAYMQMMLVPQTQLQQTLCVCFCAAFNILQVDLTRSMLM